MRSLTFKPWRIERGRYFAKGATDVRFGRALTDLEYVCARFRLWMQGCIEGVDYVVIQRPERSASWQPMLIHDPLWEPAGEVAA